METEMTNERTEPVNVREMSDENLVELFDLSQEVRHTVSGDGGSACWCTGLRPEILRRLDRADKLADALKRAKRLAFGWSKDLGERVAAIEAEANL